MGSHANGPSIASRGGGHVGKTCVEFDGAGGRGCLIPVCTLPCPSAYLTKAKTWLDSLLMSLYMQCLLVAREHVVVVTLIMAWYSPTTNPVHGCSFLNTEVGVSILRCWI